MADRLNHLKKLRRASLRGRQWKTRWGFWAVVAGAALAAVLLLATTTSPDTDVVARVNGEEITEEDLEIAWAQYWHGGLELNRAQALDHLIMEKLFYKEAEEGDFVPTDSETVQELRSMLRREGWTGDYFTSMLEDWGISYDEYMEDFKRQLAIGNYLDAMLKVTDEEARAFYDSLEDEYGPFEEEKATIASFLRAEKLLDLMEKLREKADVKILI